MISLGGPTLVGAVFANFEMVSIIPQQVNNIFLLNIDKIIVIWLLIIIIFILPDFTSYEFKKMSPGKKGFRTAGTSRKVYLFYTYSLYHSNLCHRPMLVAELWTGWFDSWGAAHHSLGVPSVNTFTVDAFEQTTRKVLGAGASINLYMFAGMSIFFFQVFLCQILHFSFLSGGTNFGFMNGGYMVSQIFLIAPT